MTDAQTEARASLWVPAKPEHAKLGWTYDFEQTERISRVAYDSTGYEATMEVVEFVMAEADRRHATALAAKDAELAWRRNQVEAEETRASAAEAAHAEAQEELNVLHANQIAHVEVRAELTAQLAEARKQQREAAKAYDRCTKAATKYDTFRS